MSCAVTIATLEYLYIVYFAAQNDEIAEDNRDLGRETIEIVGPSERFA